MKNNNRHFPNPTPITQNPQETEEVRRLKNKIREISELLLNAAEEYVKNEDYKKYANVEWDRWVFDDNGKVVRVNPSVNLYEHVVKIAQSSYIQIDELKKAIEVVNKVTKILQTSGILPKAA